MFKDSWSISFFFEVQERATTIRGHLIIRNFNLKYQRVKQKYKTWHRKFDTEQHNSNGFDIRHFIKILCFVGFLLQHEKGNWLDKKPYSYYKRSSECVLSVGKYSEKILYDSFNLIDLGPIMRNLLGYLMFHYINNTSSIRNK